MRKKKYNGSTTPPAGKRYDASSEKEENIIGKRIAEARKAKGMSIATFSKYLENYGLKISVSGAGKWETGFCIPNAYQFIAICSALEIEDQLAFFMKDYVPALNEAGTRKVAEYRDDLVATGKYRPVQNIITPISYVNMPVSYLRVSAGTGAFLDDGGFETVSFPSDRVPSGADFGVYVSGDSMEPAYHDGQIVWVHQCETLSPGDIGVFIYDGDGYIKLYDEQEPDESEAEEYTDSYGVVHPKRILISYNKAYEPKTVCPGVYFQIVGRVL